jgi:eukaryotic-like serine/threonine-protein kinase
MKLLQDDLKLHAAEHSNPSGSRMEEGSLADAAKYEYHAGNFRSGISHARQVIETSNGPKAQPDVYQWFDVHPYRVPIGPGKSIGRDPTQSSLTGLNHYSGEGTSDYEAWRNLAWARLALLREQEASARLYAARAQPSIERLDADPYEKKALLRVRKMLYGSPRMNSNTTSY